MTDTNRDLRIDVIRGLALWMIFIDHVPGDVLGHFTYRHVAFADAVDIFLLLAGISACLLYGKLILTAGFAHAQKRALHRVFQIYIGYLFIGLATVAFFFAFRHVLDDDYIVTNGFIPFTHDPVHAISAMLWLYYTPQYTSILPFYMVVIAATPAILLLLMRWETLSLLLSGGLWIVSSVFPQLDFPSLDDYTTPFNPFSWQFVFCIGLWIGKRHYLDGLPFRPVPWLKMLCWTLVIVAAAAVHAKWFGVGEWHTILGFQRTYLDSNEKVAPLLNFLTCIYLVACYLHADAPLLRSKWLAPLRVCGQHSLEVFCIGIAASLLGDIALRLFGEHFAMQLAVNGVGLGLMTATGFALDRRSALARRAAPAPQAMPVNVLGTKL